MQGQISIQTLFVMSNNNDIYDVSLVPDNVFTLDGNDFYQLVQSLAGETVCEILRIQSINSTRSFLNTDDVLEIFKYDSPDLIGIKNKSCHKMTNGHYIIKAGIKSSLAYLTKLLEIKQDQQQSIMNNDNNNSNEQTLPYEIINNNSMLRSLFSWYEHFQHLTFRLTREPPENLHMSTVLKQHGIFQLEQLSKYVFHELSSTSKMFDNSTTSNTSDDSDSYSEREPELGDADNNNNDSDEDSECQSDDNGSINTAKTNFSGIQIKDKINTELKNSYFKIKINNTDKYLHKQSAIWLLTDKNNRISTDRLSRVIETSKKEQKHFILFSCFLFLCTNK
ncbi:unnamed protein product [Didymodactylos carnosus]|uniref:Uncharacterized protein n=1 Tax=Didymodactylos carnosus TaxID=1234261 RepID=A0A814NJ81_9BILA|nr:unnamed protein product [Didymodactylos carnosus]CAF3858259.1 unnamed protein product [Didymodactylos carnosus]